MPTKPKSIVPIPVDLRKCRKGDKLQYRNGEIRYYAGENKDSAKDSFGRHRMSYDMGEAKRGHSSNATRWDGLNSGDGRWKKLDVVAVLTGPGATVKPPRPAKAERAVRTWKRWLMLWEGCPDLHFKTRREARLHADGLNPAAQVVRVEIREVLK